MMLDYDVVIVGGSPDGMALPLLQKQLGATVARGNPQEGGNKAQSVLDLSRLTLYPIGQ